MVQALLLIPPSRGLYWPGSAERFHRMGRFSSSSRSFGDGEGLASTLGEDALCDCRKLPLELGYRADNSIGTVKPVACKIWSCPFHILNCVMNVKLGINTEKYLLRHHMCTYTCTLTCLPIQPPPSPAHPLSIPSGAFLANDKVARKWWR